MTLVASCWWLKNPAALAVTPRKLLLGNATENRKAVALFVGGTTLALWMHHTGIVLLGCLLALNAIVIIAASAQRNRTTSNLLLLGLAILILWIPCGFFLLETIGPLNEKPTRLPPGIYQLGFSFDYLFGPGLTTAIHSTTSDYLAGGFTGLFALAGAAALVRRGEPLVAALLCFGAAFPVLVGARCQLHDRTNVRRKSNDLGAKSRTRFSSPRARCG